MSSSGKKVFVGNLNYETTEDDLKTAFSKAGKVNEAKVVRRGYRSKGYGFVEFETEEGAKKSVELLDKSSLNERDINVQLSTRTGTKVGGGGGGGGGIQRRNNYNRPYNNYRGPNNYQRSSRGNQRKVYFLRNNNFDNGNNRRFSNRPYRGNYNRGPNPNRNIRKTNVEKIESKTTVFVANLPFAVNDEDLIKLFDTCGPIKTAHVVKNKGRSKGYGFIEFENNEGQLKALKEMDNHMVPYKNGEQKPLSVKVAMAEVEKEKNIENEENDENEENEKKRLEMSIT